MLTTTSLNIAVLIKLAKAIRTAQKDGAATVTNRKGVAFVDVLKVTVEGRAKYLFTCSRTGKNLAAMISKSNLRHYRLGLKGFNFLSLFSNRLAYSFDLEPIGTYKAQLDEALKGWDNLACYSDSAKVYSKQRDREQKALAIIANSPYKVALQNYFNKKLASV